MEMKENTIQTENKLEIQEEDLQIAEKAINSLMVYTREVCNDYQSLYQTMFDYPFDEPKGEVRKCGYNRMDELRAKILDVRGILNEIHSLKCKFDKIIG